MASMLVERIKDVPMTKTQQKIADFFIQNQERLGTMTSLEVAQEIGVSDASIIRFSRIIGFDGFADLKEHVYDMLVQNAFSGLSLSERVSQNKEKYQERDIPGQFEAVMQRNIASVFRNNGPEDFDEIAEMIVQANNKYVLGLRGCRGNIVDFGRLLSFMVPCVHTLVNEGCVTISKLQDAAEGDVLIMFAFSRYYKVDADYLQLARERKVKIILVVNEIQTKISSLADRLILIDTESMSFFNSRIALSMTAEYLLTRISSMVDYEKRLEERDAITEEQRLSV